MNRILVTGAGGLIGSEVVRLFAGIGFEVTGVDNNMRADFFGEKGDTSWNIFKLESDYTNFKNIALDIRDRLQVIDLIKARKPDAIVHAAAQPSHDLAATRPFDDFDVNAVGTLNLLEATRQYNADIPFVHMSTNKVYGDGPNYLDITERETRYDYTAPAYFAGISETFNIDQCKHSLFGASKVAADILVQEYGKYFGMPTCCLRAGCVTGPSHSGVELHGFLSYLVKCNLEGKKYNVNGYKGKQVRDNIHAFDVASFIFQFIQKPRIAEVYNLGGGRANSVSILEAFSLVEDISGKKIVYEYLEQNRISDHICYISNLEKIQTHYPGWRLTKNLQMTFEEIYQSWNKRV